MNILKKFSLEDLSAYMECEINEIFPYIEKFKKEGIINQLSGDEYVYDNSQNTNLKRKLRIEKIKVDSDYTMAENQLFNLDNYKQFPAEQVLTNKRDLDFYNKCDERMKKILIKHIVLFNLAGNMTVGELKEYLGQISKQFPEYSMCAEWYRIKYRRYLAEGLPGVYKGTYSTLSNKAYFQFKKIYLSHNKYTQEEAYELLKMKYGYDDDSIPKVNVFMLRLRRECSKETINKLRSNIKKSRKASNDIQTFKHRKNTPKMLFKDAIDTYTNILITNKIEISQSKKYTMGKLQEYFNDYKLEDIVPEEIKKYRQYLLSKGYGVATATGFISLLLSILKMCGIVFERKIFEIITDSCKDLTNDEIRDLVMQRGAEAWVIILGLKLAELQVVQYEDIDFEKETVLVDKSCQNGKIKKLHHSQIKLLKLPPILFNSIDRNKKGNIFGKIELPMYESCLCAHIKLLQQQQVPLNIMAKEMRYRNVRTFYIQFHHLFPKELDPDFDILKPLDINQHQLTERSI